MRTLLLLVAVAMTGCFEFRKDLAACQASGHCIGEGIDPVDGGAGDAGVEARFCGTGSWCWDVSPRNPLQVLLTTSPDDAWAAGPDGLLLHFTDNRWKPVSGVPRVNIRALTKTADGQLYLGADEGLHRFDGGSFEVLSSPPRVTSVEVSPSGEVVVAANGKLCLVTGSSCSLVTAPAFEPIGLAFTESNELLAVGVRGQSAKASVGAWQWAPFTPVVTEALYSVISVGPGEAWASGAAGTLVHLVGSTWAPVPNTFGTSVLGLSATGSNDVWAADMSSNLAHWNGNRLQTSRLPVDMSTTSLSVSGSAGWLGGADGRLLRLQSGTFVPFEQGTFETINALHARGPDDVWAVTQSGEVLHRTKRGGSFVRQQLQPRPLYGVFAISATEVWATGEGGAWRFDGATWTHLIEGRNYAFVTQTRDGTIWLAGDDISTVMGSTTVVVRPGPVPAFASIATRGDTMLLGTTGGEVFECGRAGCGTTQGPSTTDVLVAATSGALFAAERGSVWMKQGTAAWVSIGSDPSDFSAMSSDGADGVFALASGGRLLHFDSAGALRSKTAIPAELLLRSLTVSDSGGSITIGGSSGALLTHDGALP